MDPVSLSQRERERDAERDKGPKKRSAEMLHATEWGRREEKRHRKAKSAICARRVIHSTLK